MLFYDQQLKALSQHLRKNMTDADKISPHPSLRKRGKEGENLLKRREKKEITHSITRRAQFYKGSAKVVFYVGFELVDTSRLTLDNG
jgi:hypothetical protein